MRDVDAFALGHLPDGFSRPGGDHISVESEEQLIGHGLMLSLLVGPCRLTLSIRLTGDHWARSSEKCSIAVMKALGAAWPSPQIDASRMAWASSFNSSASQSSRSSSATALSQPTRQGVHGQQDSSLKKRKRLSTTAPMSSRWEKITIAWLPTTEPYLSRVPKSSGRSASLAGRTPPEAPPGRYALKVCPSSM